MGVSIRMAARGVLVATVAAGLAGLVVATPAVASSRAARAGEQAAPGFASGTVPPALDRLGRISCLAASFCVAVGSYSDPLAVFRNPLSAPPHVHPLAEEWNGRTWRVMPGMHVDGVADVSCASARFCVAVGGRPVLEQFVTFKPQIGRWDGRRWTAMRPPPGPGDLTGVSCVGASFCMAVGGAEGSSCLTGAVWHGAAWHALAMPAGTCSTDGDSFLSQVSCASASDCIAVGTLHFIVDDNPVTVAVAVGWNGKTWRVLDLPGGVSSVVGLTGVSCPSSSFCLAVGDNSDVESGVSNTAVAWNGTTWTKLGPPPSGVAGLWCASAIRCVTVGGNQALTWNGTTWTGLTVSRPENAGLDAVSCWRPAACMAAGSYRRIALPGQAGAQLTLAERWNGRTWKVLPTPSPGDEQEGLSGLSCRSAANCMAVGAYVNGFDVQSALAERWNGRIWKVLPAPSPGPNENALTAISCPAAAQCIAVGYYDTAGSPRALAEQWNGHTWITLPVPHDGVLTGVSCPAVSNCMAVGSYVPPGQRAPLALSATWDGSTWTIQASPSPAGSRAELDAVACPTRTRCIAVGDYFSAVSSNLLPLTALWNGTGWTMLTTPRAGNAASRLTSISCSRPRNCMAVGRTFHLNGPLSSTLAESWDGTRWTVRPTPKLTIKVGVHLNAVSCPTPARCQAAGGYLSPAGNGFVLAEAWNGATWRRLLPITDPRTAFTDLYAISCPAARHCIAVGGTEIQRTLAYQWNGTRWQRLHTPTP